MITISVDLSRVEPLLKRLAPSERGKRMRAAMEESAGFIRAEVVKNTPVSDGTTAGSITTAIIGRPLDITGRVFSPLEHIEVLEKGRTPGRPYPVRLVDGEGPRGGKRFELLPPLLQWANRHGIPREAHFLVARKIGEKGTKAHKMFEKAIQRGRTRVVSIFTKHLTGGL